MIKYYDIRDDLTKYPKAWCYIVYSKRGPGKTYSTLRMCVEENIQFVYMKRTIQDVQILCAGSGKINSKTNLASFGADLSPFVPLNRDFGWNIKPFIINENGIAGFWRTDEEGSPVGEPIGFILACTAVSKFKGFDLSRVNYLIYDEFIPRPWDRVSKGEGDQILDFYMTLMRDKKKRGLPEIKLLALANATAINNPLFMTMELIDEAQEMQAQAIEFNYIEHREIVMHHIPGDFDIDEDDEPLGIEKAMKDSQWGQMAFGGEFGYNDFSCVKKVNLKGYQPVVAFRNKHTNYYIYRKDGNYYISSAKNDKCRMYDLNRENEQKKFYYDYVLDLRNECIDDKLRVEKYSAYDIIVNYKKYFTL